MPIYELINTDTEERHEVFMSYSSLQEHLKDNPHLSQVPCSPNIVSGISGITHKVDSGFNDVLNRIAKANPHSPLAHEHGDKGIKASKTREAVQRQKAKQ